MIPQHIAIIMDGNGRWAESRGHPRFYGHVRGAARVSEIVRECRTIGVRALTLYAFSTENWKRPDEELSVLWKLLKKYIQRELKAMKKNGIRLHVIGQVERLPSDVRQALDRAADELRDCDQMVLTFALSYGGRFELLQAAEKYAEAWSVKKAEGQSVQGLSESEFETYLQTSFLGTRSNVDLMIRTSGEKRLSNFLLWQCSYAEFDFPETLWPDFSVKHLRKSLESYGQRERRYGGV